MSMSLVSQLRPVLVKAGVVETRPRRDGNAQREHDWMIVDPRRDPSRPPSRSAPTPLAIRDTSRGRPSAVNGEGTKEDDGRAARAQPQLDEVLDILRPAFGAEILEHLVAPLNCVLAAHPEASGHDHRQAAHRTAAQAHLGNVRSPVGYFSKVLDEQTARGAGGPHGRPGRDSRLSAEVQARIERENDGFNRLMTQMGGWPTR
jgi:hypothetical protein